MVLRSQIQQQGKAHGGNPFILKRSTGKLERINLFGLGRGQLQSPCHCVAYGPSHLPR